MGFFWCLLWYKISVLVHVRWDKLHVHVVVKFWISFSCLFSLSLLHGRSSKKNFLCIYFYVAFFLGGYYIYTEASAPAKPGHKAQLISPNVQPGGQGQMCLTFWYFMYGRNVDNLNVYVQAGLVLPSQPVWKRSGTQGLQWQMATVNIRSRSVFNVRVMVYHLVQSKLLISNRWDGKNSRCLGIAGVESDMH